MRKSQHREHAKLFTKSGEEFIEEKQMPWQEYPRPQLRRDKYCLLNGTWKCNGAEILVPFPPRAVLSGYNKKEEDVLVYEKEFWLPKEFTKPGILLHFGAVDQVAEVWLNGVSLGRHEGGYLPFTFDISTVIKRGQINRLKAVVEDTLSKEYPYGKQTHKPGGMWYTPVSGIWQSVWLEEVPESYVEKMILTPDLQGVGIELVLKDICGKSDIHGMADVEKHSENKFLEQNCPKMNLKKEGQKNVENTGFDVWVELEPGKAVKQHFKGTKGYLQIEGMTDAAGKKHKAKHWTCESPHLYSFSITCGQDNISSYFALRTIAMEKQNGVNRVVLNGNPIFMHGVLDQGYYCDGLFLPAKPQEYTKDILRMKELGYNMLRKHIKVEPEYFYYACDASGMLVMQDMVNNGDYSYFWDTVLPTLGFKKKRDRGRKSSEREKEIFKQHTKETIEHLYNHPSIVAYTIFNEGWGQFDSDEMYDYVKRLDATRLVDSTSGWFHQKKNDFDSQHIYFRVIPLKPKERPLFVTECGGYTMAVKEHIYSQDKQYGYGTCDSKETLTKKILYMYDNMIVPYIKDGVCGCIYTQLSDVEEEINGLYTYDRKVCKVVKEEMRKLADRLQEQVEVL